MLRSQSLSTKHLHKALSLSSFIELLHWAPSHKQLCNLPPQTQKTYKHSTKHQQICCALGSGLEDSKIDKTYAFVSGFLRITAVKTSNTQFSAVASFELPQPRQKSRFFGLQLSNSRKSDFRQWLPSNYSRQNIKIAAFLQPSKRQKHSFRQ